MGVFWSSHNILGRTFSHAGMRRIQLIGGSVDRDQFRFEHFGRTCLNADFIRPESSSVSFVSSLTASSLSVWMHFSFDGRSFEDPGLADLRSQSSYGKYVSGESNARQLLLPEQHRENYCRRLFPLMRETPHHRPSRPLSLTMSKEMRHRCCAFSSCTFYEMLRM